MSIFPRRRNERDPEPTVTGALLAPYTKVLGDKRLTAEQQVALIQGRAAWDLANDTGDRTDYASIARQLGLSEREAGAAALDYIRHAGGAQ